MFCDYQLFWHQHRERPKVRNLDGNPPELAMIEAVRGKRYQVYAADGETLVCANDIQASDIVVEDVAQWII